MRPRARVRIDGAAMCRLELSAHVARSSAGMVVCRSHTVRRRQQRASLLEWEPFPGESIVHRKATAGPADRCRASESAKQAAAGIQRLGALSRSAWLAVPYMLGHALRQAPKSASRIRQTCQAAPQRALERSRPPEKAPPSIKSGGTQKETRTREPGCVALKRSKATPRHSAGRLTRRACRRAPIQAKTSDSSLATRNAMRAR